MYEKALMTTVFVCCCGVVVFLGGEVLAYCVWKIGWDSPFFSFCRVYPSGLLAALSVGVCHLMMRPFTHWNRMQQAWCLSCAVNSRPAPEWLLHFMVVCFLWCEINKPTFISKWLVFLHACAQVFGGVFLNVINPYICRPLQLPRLLQLGAP